MIRDLRNLGSQPVNKFTECHSDDVTHIEFHPIESNAMVSGSTDGYVIGTIVDGRLACLYNLEMNVEDECLYQVIKEDSISKVGFFGPSYEYLYSLTHIETMSLYKFAEVCECGYLTKGWQDLFFWRCEGGYTRPGAWLLYRLCVWTSIGEIVSDCRISNVTIFVTYK